MEKVFLEGTIELFLSLLLTGLLVFRWGKTIRKNRTKWFAGAWIISLVSTVVAAMVFLRVIDVSFSAWWVRMIRSIISGYLPASMFIYVMFAGALPAGHKLRGPLMAIRTDLSILGTIFYLPHTLLYVALSAPYGITALIEGNIRLTQQLMTWTGLVNTVLLIVLGITSSIRVRKKMKRATWKKLHKWSYLFYFMCFVHYVTLSLHDPRLERTLVYLMIYGTYFVMKMKRVKEAKQVPQRAIPV